MMRVCFYGAESTGKTSMAEKMAAHYRTEFVPEVAREMITSNHFTLVDIVRIGRAQWERTVEKTKSANRILFCDTDLITTQIYSQRYLRQVPQVLYDLELQIKYDQYFLFDIDVPWVPDGLRDLGHERAQMHALFKSELEKRKLPYLIVSGDWNARFEIIRKEVDRLMAE